MYIRKPEVDYIYHPFKIHLDQIPEVYLSDEHQSYIWATSKDIETHSFNGWRKEALQHYQAMVSQKTSRSQCECLS